MKNYRKELLQNGFAILRQTYSDNEIKQIISAIENIDINKKTVRKSADLFAIRQFLKDNETIRHLIFTKNFKSVVEKIAGDDFFVVKSIYFDKPPTSNWYVPYHQDLTISVDKKIETQKFKNWTTKQNQFAVQPPVELLENIITLRIHLDKTDENNGALRVIPKSHLKEIYPPQTIDWNKEKEVICDVEKGGVMLMKPLLLHSSKRTTNKKQRRVIHIELSNQELPLDLNWSEKMTIE